MLDYDTLIADLDAAEIGSCRLDVQVVRAIEQGLPYEIKVWHMALDTVVWADGSMDAVDDPNDWPAVTTSVDAALGLLARVLPDWDFEFYRTYRARSGETFTVVLEWPEGAITRRAARTPPTGRGPSLPLAICRTVAAVIADMRAPVLA